MLDLPHETYVVYDVSFMWGLFVLITPFFCEGAYCNFKLGKFSFVVY